MIISLNNENHLRLKPGKKTTSKKNLLKYSPKITYLRSFQMMIRFRLTNLCDRMCCIIVAREEFLYLFQSFYYKHYHYNSGSGTSQSFLTSYSVSNYEESSQTKTEKLIGNDANVMEAYIKLDREIWQEEQQAPAPALTHAISKLEKITSDLEKLSSEITQNQNFTFNQVPSKPDNIETENLESIDNSIKNAMTELRVMNNPKVATEHEEFIANLNRKSLKCRQLYLLNRRKLEMEEEAAKLSDKVQNLQKLYEQQDTILSEVIGSSYASEIESELNRLRNYRDALYSSELAWQDTIKLTESASIFSQAGLSSWQTIHITSNEESRFRLATETRNTIHEAALLIQSAQSMLPTVQFPYCTSREIFAILQVIEYLYTDMQITERYDHAREVYKSFQRRTQALSKWLKELMMSTIHKDIEEVDKKIAEFVTRLSTERIQQIKKKTATIGLSNGILTAESLESLDSVHQKHFVRK